MACSKKSFVSLLLFSFLQCLIAVVVMLVLGPYAVGTGHFVFNLLFYIVIFILPVFIYLSRKDEKNVFSSLGLKENRSSGLLYGLVISGFIALVFLIKNGFAISINPDELFLMIGPALAGIFEETIFRGFYLKAFSKSLVFWKANLLSSFLFAALHLTSVLKGNFLEIVFFFVLSLWLGYLYEKSKSLWAPILVHMTYNIMTILFK